LVKVPLSELEAWDAEYDVFGSQDHGFRESNLMKMRRKRRSGGGRRCDDV
jgi:hypothetical protein